MEHIHHLQARFPAEDIATGKDIFFRDQTYTLGRTVPESLHPGKVPFGVMMTGHTAQYELLRGGQVAGAAWFYFYSSFERESWAVLDEIAFKCAAQAD